MRTDPIVILTTRGPTLAVGYDPYELGIHVQVGLQSLWGHRLLCYLKLGGLYVCVSWIFPPRPAEYEEIEDQSTPEEP